jgi:hypothetical protein
MKRYFRLMIVATVIATGACNESPLATEPEVLESLLKLEVSSATLVADGLSEIRVTATIKADEPVIASKLDVQFETTGGRLLGGEVVNACETSGAVSCIKVTADRGSLKAEASLRSSTTGGPVTVTAILLSTGVRDTDAVMFTGGASGVLSFTGTPSIAEADGATAVPIVIHADSRIAAGQKVEIETSRGEFYPAGTGNKISVSVGLDGVATAELKSLEEPVSATLTASVAGAALAPARHSIRFTPALPARIVLTGDASVAAGERVELTAEFFRQPGTGSVTTGITPVWSADKVDEDGDTLAENVGRITEISPIEAPTGGATSRSATAKFEASGLVAGDRVRITVAAEDGGVTGEHFLTVQ